MSSHDDHDHDDHDAHHERLDAAAIREAVAGAGYDPDEPSLTVSTNVFIHPSEDRYLTPREMARLQTFPDDFAFEGTKTDVVKQIGNAVPVRLGEELATQVREYFPEVRDAPPPTRTCTSSSRLLIWPETIFK